MNVHEEFNNRAIRMVELITRIIRYTYVIGILEIHNADSRNLDDCEICGLKFAFSDCIYMYISFLCIYFIS